MIPGMEPRKMASLMHQMGIKQEEIPARRVTIETEEQRIVISNPSVLRITMQGASSFQISGETHVEATVRTDDVRMVAGQAGVSEETALEALRNADGDIAKAILDLSKRKE